MSLKEMRDELKTLRKEKSTVKPVSKMKKTEIALELEKLRGVREETPPVASTKSVAPKKMEAKITDIKEAKEKEFPTRPAMKGAGKKEKKEKKVEIMAGEGGTKETKMSKKDILKKLIEEMDDE